MRLLSKKGQGAMEYLTNYGWAVLVVMIVGVVLWKMGIFSHLNKTISRCNDFEEIKCFEPTVQYTSGGSRILNATFTNAIGDTIRIIDVNSQEDCTYAGDSSDTSLVRGGGDDVEITVYAGGLIHFSCQASDLADKPVGDSFSSEVTITYKETVAGIEIIRNETGRLKGFVE